MKKTGASFFLRNLIRISVTVMSSRTDVSSTLTGKYNSLHGHHFITTEQTQKRHTQCILSSLFL